MADEHMMSMPADESLETWNRLLRHPLRDTRDTPPFEVDRAAARAIYVKMGIAGIIALVGLVAVAGALLFSPTKKSQIARKSN